MDDFNWLSELKERIPHFVKQMEISGQPGRYKYSWSGDIYQYEKRWGLGNSVFAAKILYILNNITFEVKNNICSYILSFQNQNGYIYDPLIGKKNKISRILHSIKHHNTNDLFNELTKRAETRQALSALNCFNLKPFKIFDKFPKTKIDIQRYIANLEWKNPWGAASHISHLVFFINNCILFKDSNHDYYQDLIEYVFKILNDMQSNNDGSWHLDNNLPINIKINSAMKILTAYNVVSRNDFNYENKLIDLCLSYANSNHACNQFNVIYVLFNCAKKSDYRREEILNFTKNQMNLFRKHYWSKIGGFSFYEKNANDIYYGAKISKGLQEPDIHGTLLFIWAISFIADIWGIREKFAMQLHFS